jgi:hypothetical protein
MEQTLLQLASSYGVAGAIVAVAAWLLYKLIERGFTLQVPPKER